jgi:hypothetical protein
MAWAAVAAAAKCIGLGVGGGPFFTTHYYIPFLDD